MRKITIYCLLLLALIVLHANILYADDSLNVNINSKLTLSQNAEYGFIPAFEFADSSLYVGYGPYLYKILFNLPDSIWIEETYVDSNFTSNELNAEDNQLFSLTSSGLQFFNINGDSLEIQDSTLTQFKSNIHFIQDSLAYILDEDGILKKVDIGNHTYDSIGVFYWEDLVNDFFIDTTTIIASIYWGDSNAVVTYDASTINDSLEFRNYKCFDRTFSPSIIHRVDSILYLHSRTNTITTLKVEKDSLDISVLDEWSDSNVILSLNTNNDSLLVASGMEALYVIDDNPPTALSTMGYYKMDDYIFRHNAVKDSFIFSMVIPKDRDGSVEVWLMEFNP